MMESKRENVSVLIKLHLDFKMKKKTTCNLNSNERFIKTTEGWLVGCLVGLVVWVLLHINLC